MKFYSTNNTALRVDLKQAVTQGLAPDNGLYMPETITKMHASFFDTIEEKSFADIAFTVAHHLLRNDLSEKDLRDIVGHTIQFDAPVVMVEDNIYALELFHGPTLAFKDFGARFMSQLLGHYARQQEKEIVILVATSGDTGSAVANGFLGVEGVRVVVLYPSGKVSEVQEKQFTTLGQNITALEVAGTFDDCQRLVKQAFLDADLQSKFFLTSANSINIARLIPQSFYYFYAYAQLKSHGKDLVFSVPSGNFGNLTGGLLAKRMGLPVKRFIACTNVNDVVPEYLHTKHFNPRASVQTISNAMDVGNPSNFVRMMDLYQQSFENMAQDIAGFAYTDEQTRTAMKDVFATRKYVMDPHGAVGYLGLKEYLTNDKNAIGVFLETAHPGKFLDVVEETLQTKIELPAPLKKFMEGTKKTVEVTNEYEEFKATLIRQL